jgi:hypothetical protein
VTQCRQALASMWVPWVTRNVFVGHRRAVLSAQIDDLFLETEVFDPVLGPDMGAPYRCRPTDLVFLESYQNKMNKVRGRCLLSTRVSEV